MTVLDGDAWFPPVDPVALTIERHPQGSALHDAFQARRLIAIPIAPDVLVEGADVAIASFLARSMLNASSLWKPLNDRWGPTDGLVPGRLKEARVYSFTHGDRTWLCVVEPGAVGTQWFAIQGVQEQTIVGAMTPIEPIDRTAWSAFVVEMVHIVKQHPLLATRWQKAQKAVQDHYEKVTHTRAEWVRENPMRVKHETRGRPS